jgi:hypothetical protein
MTDTYEKKERKKEIQKKGETNYLNTSVYVYQTRRKCGQSEYKGYCLLGCYVV